MFSTRGNRPAGKYLKPRIGAPPHCFPLPERERDRSLEEEGNEGQQMETAISAFCQALAAFCHHVDTASKSLSDSIQRRPIPLDSAASAFLQSLDRRISCAGADLELLESMAFGTVSFEELLGHCNEVFKNHQRCIADLEDRMQSFGYVPGEAPPPWRNPNLAVVLICLAICILAQGWSWTMRRLGTTQSSRVRSMGILNFLSILVRFLLPGQAGRG
ncbi:hypothetical protein GW17_00019035 [Ensete ventricosum]|nr:hypothetical protein GW17_00019035 [Ensete ventricosum]